MANNISNEDSIDYGYDIDGVLCENDPNPKHWNNKISFNIFSNFYRIITKKMLFKPKQKYFFIISARPTIDKIPTMIWLALNGIYPNRYRIFLLNPKHFDLFSRHGTSYFKKITLIKVANYYSKKDNIIFYEDNCAIREALKDINRYPSRNCNITICDELEAISNNSV